VDGGGSEVSVEGDAKKVRIAQRLRAEMTMTLK
jgi:hypothetical protein